MQGKCDADVSFRHMFCKRHMASLPMHHVNDVVRCVLCLFYFLALPFFNPFIRQLLILFNYCPFASKKLSLVRYNLGHEHTVIVHQTNHRAVVVKAKVKFISVRFQFFYFCKFIFRRRAGIIMRLAKYNLFYIRQ